MNISLSSVGRILRGPIQQRRNQGGLWGLVLIVLVGALVPVAFFLAATQASGRDRLGIGFFVHSFEVIAMALLGLGLVGYWALLVANLLEQNHPTLARLVPRHAQHLRAVFVSMWLLAIALATAGPGVFTGDVLGWAAGSAVALAALAAAVRWPMLWFAGCFAPILTTSALRWPWFSQALSALLRTWQAAPLAITVVLVVAGAAGLMSLVRNGDARHVASHAARKCRNLRFQSRMAGIQPLTAVDGPQGWTTRISSVPYTWWMRRVLARTDSALTTRLLIGLGPGAHWTTRVGGAFLLLGLGIVFVAAASLASISREIPSTLSGLSFGMMFGLIVATLQTQARLHQTQREQALLMLLPGTPRGGALNRWLSGHLTLNFMASWLAAGALMTSMGVAAERLDPGQIGRTLGQGRELLWVAMIPLIAYQWRRWYRMAAPTQLNALIPALLGLLLGAATWGTKLATGLGYAQIGTVVALVVLAWGACRWRRMGAEPSAFPVGRLAR